MRADSDAALRVAVALGANALVVWAASVVAAVLVAVLALRLRQRRLARDRGTGRATPTGVLLRIGAGFVLVAGSAALFAALAQGRHAGAAVGRFDEALALALQRATPDVALHAFALLTHAGDPVTLTILGVAIGLALLRTGRPALACAWVAALLGNAGLNTTLKALFMRVRPVHETAFAQAQGYSFPSGHTSGALVCYGMLAYVAVRVLAPAWHLPVLGTAAVLAVSTGFSRVFLGVHHASDVLAGTLSGAAWLAVCIAAVEFHQRRAGHVGR